MRRKRFLIVALVLALVRAWLPVVQPAYADTIVVDTTSDVLDAAGSCGTVTVASLPGADLRSDLVQRPDLSLRRACRHWERAEQSSQGRHRERDERVCGEEAQTDPGRFGQWAGVELSDSNKRQVYVPPGFAHGFCVLSEQVDFIYKCTDFYVPEDEYGIAWDDPELAIDWPQMDYMLSDRDRQLPRLSENRNLPDYRAA